MKSLPTTPLACTCINSLAVPVFVCIDSFGSAEGAFDPDFSLDSDWQHHWRTAASCTLSIHSLEGMEHNSRCTAEWLHLKWISTQNLKKKKKTSVKCFFTAGVFHKETEEGRGWEGWQLTLQHRLNSFLYNKEICLLQPLLPLCDMTLLLQDHKQSIIRSRWNLQTCFWGKSAEWI